MPVEERELKKAPHLVELVVALHLERGVVNRGFILAEYLGFLMYYGYTGASVVCAEYELKANGHLRAMHCLIVPMSYIRHSN